MIPCRTKEESREVQSRE